MSIKTRVLAALLPIGALAGSQAGSHNAEEAVIRKTIEDHYFKAHATGSGEPLRGVFVEEGRMFWSSDGQLRSRTSTDYINGFSGQPAEDESQRRRRVLMVDVSGDVAVAKAELDYPDIRLIDYFSLVRTGGEWRIVNKLFQRYPKPGATDTLRLEVGSTAINGAIYQPHAARVRVRVGDRLTAEWTNELALGDSAGRRVIRWVTKGNQFPATGTGTSWELRQTYDAISLAPYTYHLTSSSGAFTQLTLEGRRVRGTKRLTGDSVVQQVDVTLDRPGFFAGASDLVPPAVGLKAGVVMTAPVWSPAASRSELRIFTVVGRETVDVEGTSVEAWRVEERRHADRGLHATWYLLEQSPYMVYGEVALPNGQVQRMTEVELWGPKRSR